jgi:RNA polymerase sigma factor (sigma-70 family)
VRRVATARCVDRLRRRRPITPLDPAIPDPGPSPYDDAVRSDERARLRRALQELDVGCRELLRAHFLEEEGYTAIAARTERAESTIRWQVLECLKRVRKLWRRE